jgi:hypothetical protein
MPTTNGLGMNRIGSGRRAGYVPDIQRRERTSESDSNGQVENIQVMLLLDVSLWEYPH